MFCRNQTADTTFNVTASENGNYTFHFVNSFLIENITVVLNYKLEFNVALQVKPNVNYSVGTARVLPLPPEFPDDSRETESEKLHKRYLNWREADEIFKMIRAIRMYMPIRSFLGMVEIAGLALFSGLVLVVVVSSIGNLNLYPHTGQRRMADMHAWVGQVV